MGSVGKDHEGLVSLAPPKDHIEKKSSRGARNKTDLVGPIEVVALPSIFVEVVQQMLNFLSGLGGTGSTFTAEDFQASLVHSIIVIASRIYEVLGNDAFAHSVLGSLMTSTKYDLRTKFLKMKPLTFQGTKSKNAFKFIH